MINPTSQKLPLLTPNRYWAALTRLDSKGSYEFLINPEELQESHKGEYALLPVLNTAQPHLKAKYSAKSFKIPRVLFWTTGNSRDLSGILKTIADMVHCPTAGTDSPLVSFRFGEIFYPRLYLKEFNIVSRHWRQGKITGAEGSMDFLIVPAPPVPNPGANKLGTKKPTPREQAKKKA